MAGFREIIGHKKEIAHLEQAIRADKVSHAYIFNGDKGTGKKTLADAFAMTLQCSGEGERPCGECHSCKQAMSGNHPDIIYVRHEKPTSIGVEDIRDQLTGDIQIRPYNGKYKIYIIADAEKMTVQAQNAILKTIEEPPAYAVIILLTTNDQIFLDTIRSRCVTLNLKPVPDERVKEYLMEQLQIPDYQADICAAFAQQLLMEQLQLLAARNPEAVLLITDCQVYGKQFGTEHSLKESELGFISHTAAAEISLQYMRMAEHLVCRLAEEEKMHVRVARQNLRTETENLEQVMEAVLRVLLYGEDGEIYNLPQSGKPWEYGEEDDRSPLAPIKIVPDTGKTDDRTSLGR